MYGTLVDIRTDEHSRKFQLKYSEYVSKKFGADGSFFEKFFSILSPYSDFDEPDIVRVLQGAVKASGGKITDKEAEVAALKFRKLSTHKLKLYRGVKTLLKTLKKKKAVMWVCLIFMADMSPMRP